jgi:ubiquinone/menaquinone biosynthesis C-methylase UbiE
MLARRLEPEIMDTPEDARDYDAMDHSAVNAVFVSDFLRFRPAAPGHVLDVGTGTAQIPIELCRHSTAATVVALDAAGEMLKLARANVARAGFDARILVADGNANHLPFPTGAFDAVLSNSIVHHIPDPYDSLTEMVRVCKLGGHVFVRDLLRPDDEPTLERLVDTYAAGANDRQRQLFHDSLWAALTLAEVQSLVAQLGFPPDTVAQTSDRHWTWSAVMS